MARVDVTVRGGGIFGLSIAWACLQRGARVRVIGGGQMAEVGEALLGRVIDAYQLLKGARAFA